MISKATKPTTQPYPTTNCSKAIDLLIRDHVAIIGMITLTSLLWPSQHYQPISHGFAVRPSQIAVAVSPGESDVLSGEVTQEIGG